MARRAFSSLRELGRSNSGLAIGGDHGGYNNGGGYDEGGLDFDLDSPEFGGGGDGGWGLMWRSKLLLVGVVLHVLDLGTDLLMVLTFLALVNLHALASAASSLSRRWRRTCTPPSSTRCC